MAYIQKNNPIPKTGCGRRRMQRMSSPFDQKTYPPNYTEKDIKFLKDQNEDVVRDDDKTGMSKKQQRKHRRNVLKYNKTTAKPLSDEQKNKIKKQLSKMDPKDPEAKLLRKTLNLKKNQ